MSDYDTPQEQIWYETLGGCGCGDPEAAYSLLHDCVKAFDRRNGWEANAMKVIAGHVAEDPETAALVIAYMLADKGLTEHGGSVFGSWLTELGEKMIALPPLDYDPTEARP